MCAGYAMVLEWEYAMARHRLALVMFYVVRNQKTVCFFLLEVTEINTPYLL